MTVNIQKLPVEVQLMVARFLPREERAQSVVVSKVVKEFMDHRRLWSEMASVMNYKVSKDPKQDFLSQHLSAVNRILLSCLPDEKTKTIKALDPFAQREVLEKFLSDNQHRDDFSQFDYSLDYFYAMSPQTKIQVKSASKILLKHGVCFNNFVKLLDDPDFHKFFGEWCEMVKKKAISTCTQAWDWAIKQPDPTNYIKALVEAGTFPAISNIVNGIMRIVLSKTPEERKKTESIFSMIKDKTFFTEIQKMISGVDAYYQYLVKEKKDSDEKILANTRELAQNTIDSFYSRLRAS